MKRRLLLCVTGLAPLSACASLGDEHSVSSSPYTVPVNIAGDDRDLGGLRYPGSGHYAYDANGNRVRLSRRERRQMRERYRNVRAQIEQNELVAEFNAENSGPPEPVPSAPPVASRSHSAETSAASSSAPARGGGSLPR